MAKTAKSHHGLSKPLKKQQQQKAIPAKGSKKVAGAAKITTKVTAKKLAVEPQSEVKKEAVVAKPAGKPTPVVGDPKKPGSMFSRPQMRRGRRPKALADYKPNSDEEENREEEVDYKGLEYDTGIRVAKPRDDNPFNMDRFDDYDEELNFDF